MKVFEWHNGPVPENLVVKQVYGLAFSHDGRLLLKVENVDGKKSYSLAGGKPESSDADHEATLRREFLEEVNTELEAETCVVGYQIVNEPNGTPPYAQLRLAAKIKNIGSKQPDPDGGEIYDRILVSPKKAIQLLNWIGGKKMVKQAVKIAKSKFNMKTFSKIEEEF